MTTKHNLVISMTNRILENKNNTYVSNVSLSPGNIVLLKWYFTFQHWCLVTLVTNYVLIIVPLEFTLWLIKRHPADEERYNYPSIYLLKISVSLLDMLGILSPDITNYRLKRHFPERTKSPMRPLLFNLCNYRGWNLVISMVGILFLKSCISHYSTPNSTWPHCHT